jgi:hypothetical protein
MEVIFPEMVTDASLEQLEKAFSPILVTSGGMTSSVSPLQLLKAYSPIVVTRCGRVMEVSSVQPKKARGPMADTDAGITVFLQPATRVLVAVSMMALQLFLESYTGLPAATVIDSKPGQ